MKEVLTKRFWKDVKKTFDEALEGSSPVDKAPQTSAEGSPSAAPTPDSPPASSQQH